MNTRQLLREAAAELREAGVPDPEYDSGLLLAQVLGKPPLELRMGMEVALSPAQEEAFQSLMCRRRNREPLQYILGTVIFRGHSFRVRPGALIPRPETELLSAWAQERIAQMSKPKVLDLCCGSGCLGISLKLAHPSVEVTLTDLSPEALELTGENARALHAECEILQGDLFEAVDGKQFNLIISNPPYIPSRECDAPQEELLFEPRMALDGGEDGLTFYRRIAKEASIHLLPEGRLMMELGMGEAEPVSKMLRDHGAKRVEIKKDDAGIDRMILAEYP